MERVVVALITFVSLEKIRSCVLFFIGIDGRERDRYVNARFAVGRHYYSAERI
jgi:hypothetical protein